MLDRYSGEAVVQCEWVDIGCFGRRVVATADTKFADDTLGPAVGIRSSGDQQSGRRGVVWQSRGVREFIVEPAKAASEGIRTELFRFEHKNRVLLHSKLDSGTDASEGRADDHDVYPVR